MVQGKQSLPAPELERRVVELYHQGMGLKPIARELRTSPVRVWAILDREGVPRRPVGRRIPPEMEERIVKLRTSGLSLPKVSDLTGASTSTVQAVMIRRGLKPPREWHAPRELQQRVRQLYRAGHSIKEVEEVTGLGRAIVHNILVYTGVKRRAPSHRTSPELERAIVQAFERGSSLASVVRELGVGRSAVRMTLFRNGAKELMAPPPRRDDPELQARAVKLYQERRSVKHVARAVHVRDTTVREILLRHGVRLREKGT